MDIFTSYPRRGCRPILVLWLSFAATGVLNAQTQTNLDTLALPPTNLSLTNAPSTSTNTAPASQLILNPQTGGAAEQQSAFATQSQISIKTPALDGNRSTDRVVSDHAFPLAGWMVLASLMTLGSLAGFLLYQSGLTQAKNCGHSATLLVLSVIFGVIGYWVGGFAVETGGIGDAHAALAQPIPIAGQSALDHELGFIALGHHWGIMGSSGFFLATDDSAKNGSAALFLSQAVLLALAVAAALGAALERARLLAMAVFSFLIGALIYPLFANWVWGGGWLAELGREYGLGHGFVDIAGAGVVHQTAGTLALVLAIVLGPRTGRFGRGKKSIPGHNMPLVLLGAVLLLISWTATNAFGQADPQTVFTPIAGLAAMNTLLAAAGGLLTSFFLSGWQKRKPEPALLSRGLLGGAVASCGCSAFIDPWAAFIIGGLAGLLVQGAVVFLEKRRIDDPVNAAATHGVGGAWGVLATGLFANGVAGQGYNGVEGPVRGLFFGGALHQLTAQVIGAVTGFVVVFILGYACLIIVQKILGLRVSVADETEGLDRPQTGVLGYQGDAEPENQPR